MMMSGIISTDLMVAITASCVAHMFMRTWGTDTLSYALAATWVMCELYMVLPSTTEANIIYFLSLTLAVHSTLSVYIDATRK